jgi:hypothetical protein
MTRLRRTAALLTALALAGGAQWTAVDIAAGWLPPELPTAPVAHRGAPHHSAAQAAATLKSRPALDTTSPDLEMAFTSVSPAGLDATKELRLSGTVTNLGSQPWWNAKVYLSVESAPARDKEALEYFAEDPDGFGQTVNDLDLFDEIGRLRPGSITMWNLSIPFGRLPIDGSAGVYKVGATLLGTNADGRDSYADSRVSTTVPYLPDVDERPNVTEVVTLVPIVAPVVRDDEGVFVDDKLAELLSYGQRLRNLLDFAEQAPAGSLELVLDPALRNAVRTMSKGYSVRSLTQASDGEAPRAGVGQHDAAAWLGDLTALKRRHRVSLLPWGNPATTSLARAGMPGIVRAAVDSSLELADDSSGQRVVDWQLAGATSRRGLKASDDAGATVHITSERSLPSLAADDEAFPPSLVTISTGSGRLPVVVTRSDVGGRDFTRTMSALDFRQSVLAEATVRALSEDNPTSVIAAPFNWDPGTLATGGDIQAGYDFPTVSVQELSALTARPGEEYTGKLRLLRTTPQLSGDILDAIRTLHGHGNVYTELLVEESEVGTAFTQWLAQAGSAAWSSQPARGAALIRQRARDMAEDLAKVTVSGPAFVAMSSNTGRFPLTIFNGLDSPVTVKISVNPLNKALQISSLPELRLEAGESRDLEVESRADRSGLTQVRARLSTVNDRSFGRPFSFNIRTTQIGVAIWVAMGIGMAALLLSAGRRLYVRARGRGFKTRGETTA